MDYPVITDSCGCGLKGSRPTFIFLIPFIFLDMNFVVVCAHNICILQHIYFDIQVLNKYINSIFLVRIFFVV